MDERDIPQDESPIFAGQRKLVYATRNGRYVAGLSSGWADEVYATTQAVRDFDERTEAAWQQYRRGERSPLFYLMYRYRHDEASLAMAAGVFRWQLRRHLDPVRFAALPERTLHKYAQALCLTLDELRAPEREHAAGADGGSLAGESA